jgi:hypothetical protein
MEIGGNMIGIGEDRLDGAKDFARAIFGDVSRETVRKTYHLLEHRRIPAAREGGKWIGSKTALSQHYAKLIGLQAAGA